MCGIVGILGKTPVATQIVDALKRLEYRGYDSAGVATLEDGGRLERRRAEGKLGNLEVKLSKAPLAGAIGIGHTRWATHGRPNETQRPPARDREARRRPQRHHREFPRAQGRAPGPGRALRDRDRHRGRRAARHAARSRKGKSPIEAVAATLPRLRGAFALAFLFAGEEDQLIGARHGAAARGRLRRGRDVSRLGRPRARALHRRGRPISRTATGPCCRAQGVDDPRSRGRARSSGRASASRPAPSWSRRATTAISWRRRSTSSPRSSATRSPTTSTSRPGQVALPDDAAVRLQGADAPVDLGLRHRLLRRADRQVLVRAPGAPAGRDRRRLRVPLPRAAAGRGRARALHLAVRRDRRHARLAALRQGAGAARRSPSSTCRPRPWRARAPPSPRRSPAPRSASPRPRPSPASSPCCSASRSRPGARAARSPRRRRPSSSTRSSRLPGLMAEALKLEPQIEALNRDLAQGDATCSISAAAPPTRSRSKAR